MRRYPWHSLASVSREEASAHRSLLRWADARASLTALAGALRHLLAAEIELLVRSAAATDGVEARADAVAVLLAGIDEDPVAAAFVEVESALASAILTRVLRRPVHVPLAAADPRSPSLAGALAAVLVSCARRHHRGAPLRVLAAGSSADVVASLPRAEGGLACASLTVLLDHDAYSARAAVPLALARAALLPRWDRAALAALGPVPLTMPVVAAAFAVTLTDVASLAPGDALLPGRWGLRSAGTSIVGPVYLSAPSATVGLRADLVEGGRLVLRGELDELVDPGASEGMMVDTNETDALLENVGALPVVLRVEVGEATMPARDWAALRQGDVVTLGRRLGDPVVIRSNGAAIATGELVEVDGEVAVRILGRTAVSGKGG